MAPRVVLHVGIMKSGTSYLQSRLFANKAELGERGVLVPGRAWTAHVYGVSDVLDLPRLRGTKHVDGAWDRLVTETAAHDGTSVISMEFFGPASAKGVARVLSAFEDPVVVVTARDLNRSIVAMWQETLQNGKSWGFDEYVAAAKDYRPGRRDQVAEPPAAGKAFWRQQNLPAIVRAWGRGLAEHPTASTRRVQLVTVPPPGAPRDLLWERFAAACGFAPEGLDKVQNANESLGAASALALRRFNELMDAQGLAFPDGAHWRKQVLAKQVLSARKREEPSIGLPVSSWVEKSAASMVDRVRDLDVDLVGDWADLRPVAVPGIRPDEVPAEQVAEAALVGLAGIAQRYRDHLTQGPGGVRS